MIEQEAAATEIRRLSRLKNYPRSWESAGSAATEQDSQAEAALIEAAAASPSLARLRQWVSNWERRRLEAPLPAELYRAWEEVEHFDCKRPAQAWDHQRGEWVSLAGDAA